ncbi:hypothetical protein PMAYCL1PPCAC_07601 [Pristionchus mayeri]|uniref:Uncharacterized protein n=1 Tax=Pristionchus mayeri TaxID=1317129 RepID=A0AAN4ZE14_9BILA|nr:hypothetical protein PMAYCL1PPCAC_07601 [Pristionchus mayeri]
MITSHRLHDDSNLLIAIDSSRVDSFEKEGDEKQTDDSINDEDDSHPIVHSIHRVVTDGVGNLGLMLVNLGPDKESLLPFRGNLTMFSGALESVVEALFLELGLSSIHRFAVLDLIFVLSRRRILWLGRGTEGSQTTQLECSKRHAT